MYILGYSGYTRDSRLGQGARNPLGKTEQDFDNIFEFRDGEVPFSYFPLGYFGHDASAAIIKDGKVIACAAEERFTRVKYSLNLAGNTLLPKNAIEYCLKEAGIAIKDVDIVAHYCDFSEHLIEKRLELLCDSMDKEDEFRTKEVYQNIYSGMMKREVVHEQFRKMTGQYPQTFLSVAHHEAHAASAFFPSGFNNSLILTIDGTGEIESSLLAHGLNNSITEISRTLLPTSLGSLYLIITVYLGFRSLGDEYKVMGLASYGDPSRYRDFFSEVVILESCGNYSTPLIAKRSFKEMILKKLGPARRRNDPFDQRHADIAAALQESVQNAVLHQLKYTGKETGIKNLCLAGGVALNCTMNGAIASSGLFKNIFVQPASSDEGCSVGSALYTASKLMNNKTSLNRKWEHAYLGPGYTMEEILKTLENYSDKIKWSCCADISSVAAQSIKDRKVIGWFQGKMEFGPRALGNRSILADPRDKQMKERINTKVKRRELFRPFAPAVLEEDAKEYFEMGCMKTSPFMLFTFKVKADKRDKIPAVTHVDGSSRIQTVSGKSNPLFRRLINEFKQMTGIPVVLNTSFNVKNEPIVCSPDDAVRCFLSTDIDALAIGNYFVKKRDAN